MALDFPNTPAVGAIYSSGSAVWQWDGTKWVNAGGIVGPTGPMGPAAGRNLLHNALFQVQQRGTGPWTTTNYTADRWRIALTGGDTDSVTVVALADADRAVIGDETAQNAVQVVFVGSATAGSYSLFNQRVESVRRLSGKIVTVSFWAHATSGTPRLGVGYSQVFGSGGSPSANITGNFGITPALSTTWQRYTLTGTIPSSAGKTFGTTAGTDFTQIEFFLSDQGSAASESGGIGVQSGTVQLWGAQLELGGQATPLEKVEYRYDLANCQRFYVVQAGYLYGFAASGTDLVVLWTFPVTMRAGPNITLLTTSPYSEQPPFAGAHTASGASFPNNHAGSNTGFDIHITGFSGFTTGAVASLGPNCLAASADL